MDDDLKILKLTADTANDFFRLLHASGYWLSGEVLSQVIQAGRLFLEGFCTLASRAAANKLLMFKLRPKLHMMAELVMSLENSTVCPNLLSSACWTDEDFIGLVSQTSRASHRGATGLALSLRTLQKCLGRYKTQFNRATAS